MVCGKKWAPTETAVLVSLYPSHSAGEIAGIVGHPVASVKKKVTALGLKKSYASVWTPWKIDFLKRHYATTKNEKLAAWLDVGHSTLKMKARELNLEKTGNLWRCPRKNPDGTLRRIGPEEEAYILAHLSNVSMTELSARLGLSECAVSAYCRRKGIPHPTGALRIGDDGKMVTIGDREDAYIREHIGHMSKAAIAREIGFSRTAVGEYCKRHGIESPGKTLKRVLFSPSPQVGTTKRGLRSMI